MSLASLLMIASCVWIYPQHPGASAPKCVEFAYPPATDDQPFLLVDEVFGVTLDEALAAPPRVPKDFMRKYLSVTREMRLWGMRQSAHHLGLAHSYLRNVLKRDTPSKLLGVLFTSEPMGSGSLTQSTIHLGGEHELSSETIYHEYAHHLIAWENPNLMSTRGAPNENPIGYGIIEAYANHYAFVLDDEPRFSEYYITRACTSGSKKDCKEAPQFVYSVETDCTFARCDQFAASVDDTYRSVIAFGALLWDMRKRFGGPESLRLMLDSIRLLETRGLLNFRVASEALLAADGGRNTPWIRSRIRYRLGDIQ